MILIELQKAENGFVLVTYPEVERVNVRWYIAKDVQEVGELCRNLADNYGEYGEERPVKEDT